MSADKQPLLEEAQMSFHCLGPIFSSRRRDAVCIAETILRSTSHWLSLFRKVFFCCISILLLLQAAGCLIKSIVHTSFSDVTSHSSTV